MAWATSGLPSAAETNAIFFQEGPSMRFFYSLESQTFDTGGFR